MTDLSLIIPVHNEEKRLEKNALNLSRELSRLFNNYEILICDNGSTDKTQIIGHSLEKADNHIKYQRTERRGLGLGIRIGIEAAQYEILFFYAIDIPFGIKIIKDSSNLMEKYDFVIGSKRHKDSVYISPFKRKLSTFIYNTLVNTFFNLHVRDTQGSLCFKRSKIMKYLSSLKSEDMFFQTELLIYGKICGLRIHEIPVRYISPRSDSKIKLVGDGKNLISQVILTYREIRSVGKLGRESR